MVDHGRWEPALRPAFISVPENVFSLAEGETFAIANFFDPWRAAVKRCGVYSFWHQQHARAIDVFNLVEILVNLF